MRGEKKIKVQGGLLAAVAGIALACPAQAQQDTEGWTLQPSTPTSGAPSAQGPVDAQNPVVRPAETESSAQAETPTPVPTIAAPPPTLENGMPAAPDQQPQEGQSSRVIATRTPAAAPSGNIIAPAPFATGEATAPTAPVASSDQPTVAPAVAPTAATSGTGLSWWWALVPLGAAGLGAFLWLRRRRPEEETEEWASEPEAEKAETPAPPVAAPPVQPARAPQPAFGVVPPAAPRPAQPPQPQPPAQAEPAGEPVEIAFEPVGLRISLIYATLQYRVTLRANADRTAGHIVGDMISAHASLPQAEQLAPPLETMPPLKALPAMKAGETISLTGEIQLPLNALRPLRQGSATYLVPLIRLYVVNDGSAQLRRVYTVGTIGNNATVSPIRLDTGSRMVNDLAAREVEAARAFPLAPQPRRAAG